jgi:hypothetical protein
MSLLQDMFNHPLYIVYFHIKMLISAQARLLPTKVAVPEFQKECVYLDFLKLLNGRPAQPYLHNNFRQTPALIWACMNFVGPEDIYVSSLYRAFVQSECQRNT